MVGLCQNMEWRHLPLAGGLLDQTPDFIEACYVYFDEKNKEEARKAKEEERKREADKRMGQMKGRRR